jgi:peptide/nickel transport system permease protein
MKTFILRRLGYSAISLCLLSLTIFLFIRLTGDPTVLLVEPGASREDMEMVRQQLGLDRSLWVQYATFVGDIVRGDFGKSFYYRTPVLELYLSRLPSSLMLAAAAMIFSLVIGIPSGIIAAVSVGKFWDTSGKVFSLLGLSMPQFWVGLLLILFVSVYLGWLPSSGSGTIWHVVMPAFALGWFFAAAHMRITRSSMLDVLGSEYVKLARLKGLPEKRVIVKHALKNALIPVVTLLGPMFAAVGTGSFFVESIFRVPGMGRFFVLSMTGRDYPMIMAVVLTYGVFLAIMNLVVDLAYGALDPRIRY